MKKGIVIIIGLAALLILAWTTNIGCKGTEKTVWGSVTSEGQLLSEDGKLYTVLGAKADDLKEMAGKEIEIKGMVKERKGKTTITVQDYIVLYDAPAQPYAAEEEPEENDSAPDLPEQSPEPLQEELEEHPESDLD